MLLGRDNRKFRKGFNEYQVINLNNLSQERFKDTNISV